MFVINARLSAAVWATAGTTIRPAPNSAPMSAAAPA
jgi:hypothetical protein